MAAIAQPNAFPRAPLIGAAVLIVLSVTGAAVSHMTGFEKEHFTASAVAERDLRFTDRADGSVGVFDARTGDYVATVPPGSNGFLRATVRGLARQRLREGMSVHQAESSAPFHLTAWSDGRLTLRDPDTGRNVELEAFGETNETAFAQLLADPESKP